METERFIKKGKKNISITLDKETIGKLKTHNFNVSALINELLNQFLKNLDDKE